MVELVDYSISYGECVGYCMSMLTIDGLSIELSQMSNGADKSERRFTGKIEAGLRQRIVQEAARLEHGNLSEVYGTPDARDEGAVTIRTRGPGGVTEHRYSRGDPPREFAALDALLSPILVGWVDGEASPGVHFNDAP